MARRVRDSKLERKSDRDRLRAGPKAYWTVIVPGKIMLGYRRRKASLPGQWLARRYVGSNGKGGGKYKVTTLAFADDYAAANGDTVLSYGEAQAKVQEKVIPAAPITVREAISNYIAYLRSEGKQTKDAEQRANALILPTLGDKLVAELESDDIRKWIADYAERPALIRPKKNGKRKERAPLGTDREAIRRRRASANRLLTIFKAAMNLAFDDERVDSNLAWKRVKPYLGVDIPRSAYLSVEEVQRLINASDAEFRPLVRGALETGARYGELIALRVSDFDAASKTVHVRHSKSGKDRRIVLGDDGVAFFKNAVAGRLGDEFIFRRKDGAPWGKAHQNRFMDEAVDAAKIRPRITFHGLRHTWASHAVMDGMPLTVLARNLGHATIAMVQKHYGHMHSDYISETIRQYAPRWGISDETNVTAIPAKRRARDKRG